MYNLAYFVLFYGIGAFVFIAVLGLLLALGFFKSSKIEEAPKTTLEALADKVKKAKGDKGAMDAVMHDFYAHYYNVASVGNEIPKWLDLIQAITLSEYMSVEQAANFRDDLAKKSPMVKKEIEQAVGVSLKAREKNKKK